MSLQPYSVVLMRPDYICEGEPFGQNCYVAYVMAENPEEAVKPAQEEAFQADDKAGSAPNDPDDYYPLLVLGDHVDIKRFGFQL